MTAAWSQGKALLSALVVCLALTTAAATTGQTATPHGSSFAPRTVTSTTADSVCAECHGVKGFAVPKGPFGESPKRTLFVEADQLQASVHGKERCVTCHQAIDRIPHQPDRHAQVDCIRCHAGLPHPPDEVRTQVDLSQAMVGLPAAEPPPPPKIAVETGHYLDSVHARPRKTDPSRPNAQCWECHGKHNVLPAANRASPIYRLGTVETCGACHTKALKEYTQSIHGAAAKRKGSLETAVCGDCHTAHRVASPKADPVKLAITENCGSCHEKELKTYRQTYHGQVTRLGYAHTAKCHDCHGAHPILSSKDSQAPTNPRNRLKTCSAECHKQATAGFITFEPHGNTHDLKRFPALWIASKFMILLLVSVFLFFWAHSALWFYREHRERLEHHRQGEAAIRIDQEGAPVALVHHVRRFSPAWRIVHLVLVLAVMSLVLTGMTVLYADSFWAPTMMNLLGGPKVAAVIHRTAATVFGAIFFGHLIAVFYKIFVWRPERFRWFGPESLLPNVQDLRDLVAMTKWFFGKGPRPAFDRWTYWEKFDYWAPFWGMVVIGCSGLMLWFPNFFAAFLPGWVFNVATIVHGEEAFLAAVFLFTVHFFNSHFRPDKFPLDVVMFTGTVPLEEFKRERPLEFDRLVQEGALERYLVPAPSAGLMRGSRILGFVLLGAGLGLLALVLLGFFQSLWA
jgi:cytochrome b subunit of formate dehydrogenase